MAGRCRTQSLISPSSGRYHAAAMPRALLLLSAVLGLIGCPSVESADDDIQPPPIPPTAVIGATEIRARVGDPVTLDGSASVNAVAWRWTFGDGTATDLLASPTATHVWTAPGHYLVALEVENSVGSPDTTTVRASITWERDEAAPTRANLLDIDFDRDSVLALATDFDAVAVVRPVEATVSQWYATCSRPTTLSHARSGGSTNTLLVACPDDDMVQVWDTANHTLRESIQLPRGSRPWSVVAPSTGTAGWVALQALGQVVEIIVPPTGAVAVGRTIDVLPDPRGLALHDDTPIVSRHRSEDAAAAFVLVDTDDGEVTEHSLAFDPGPDSDTTHRGVPSYLQQITVSPDGRRAFFPSLQSNIARGLYRDGQAMTHETTNRAILSQAALTTAEVEFAGVNAKGDELLRSVFDDRDMAVSAAFAPDGDWVHVGHLGMEAIDVLDAYTGQSRGGVQGLTGGAQGLRMTADGATLFAISTVSRTLWALDVSGSGNPVVTSTWDLTGPGPDPLTAAQYAGRLIFQRSADVRMTQDGYLSCASCHLDGDDDRRVWDFTDRGEGLRSTISLLGRAGSAPIHWSANFDELQDFENDVRGPMSGAGFLADADWELTSDTLGESKTGRSADLDALAAYVASLDTYPASPFRDADGEMTPDALAGQAIFEDAAVGCADCHPGPTYTDSQWLAPGQPLLQDVGTFTEASGGRMGGPLTGLDTPTLRGLHATPPYLHDGTAPTLRDVLVDRNPGDAHGVTSGLTESQLDQLERFLLELQ